MQLPTRELKSTAQGLSTRALIGACFRKVRKLALKPNRFFKDYYEKRANAASRSAGSLDALAVRHDTDKSSKHHNYVRHYETFFSPMRDEATNVLEIGVKDGASLRMWRDYFPNACIHGIDNRAVVRNCEEERIRTWVGLQQDADFLRAVCEQISGPIGVMIDDGSHHNPYTIASFRGLFPHLQAGGVYVIEDLHCSYEEHQLFNNKRSDMLGFFNELINSVDINGRRDVFRHIGSSQDFGKINADIRSCLTVYERWIASLHFFEGILFVQKRLATD